VPLWRAAVGLSRRCLWMSLRPCPAQSTRYAHTHTHTHTHTHMHMYTYTRVCMLVFIGRDYDLHHNLLIQSISSLSLSLTLSLCLLCVGCIVFHFGLPSAQERRAGASREETTYNPTLSHTHTHTHTHTPNVSYHLSLSLSRVLTYIPTTYYASHAHSSQSHLFDFVYPHGMGRSE
jgi:hypothetical protein